MQRIALLGLGTMGAGMAANWLAKGFSLKVWNRTRAKAQPLSDKGASVGATPRDAAEDADFVFAMVADDSASREIWLGYDGALGAARPGAVIVESSTLTPTWVRELAGHVQAKGCGFLDAPVGGSRIGWAPVWIPERSVTRLREADMTGRDAQLPLLAASPEISLLAARQVRHSAAVFEEVKVMGLSFGATIRWTVNALFDPPTGA